MKQNHELIFALIELCNQIPESDPQDAIRRLAVLIDSELGGIEESGLISQSTREALLETVKKSLAEHKKNQAA